MLAIRVFRQIGNAAMVLSLEEILHIEDINFLSGYSALLLDKTDKAKMFFAKSVNPQVLFVLLIDTVYFLFKINDGFFIF